MPRIKKEDKEAIKELPHNELVKIVTKLISKDKSAYDYLYINYLNKEDGENDLYMETLASIKTCFNKNIRGSFQSKINAKMLSLCITELKGFTNVSKNKLKEADLLMIILEEALINRRDSFGPYFTAFDNKVAQITKRLLTIITKKIHPDYFIDYQNDVNIYLKIITKYSCHNDFTYELPEYI